MIWRNIASSSHVSVLTPYISGIFLWQWSYRISMELMLFGDKTDQSSDRPRRMDPGYICCISALLSIKDFALVRYPTLPQTPHERKKFRNRNCWWRVAGYLPGGAHVREILDSIFFFEDRGSGGVFCHEIYMNGLNPIRSITLNHPIRWCIQPKLIHSGFFATTKQHTKAHTPKTQSEVSPQLSTQPFFPNEAGFIDEVSPVSIASKVANVAEILDLEPDEDANPGGWRWRHAQWEFRCSR